MSDPFTGIVPAGDLRRYRRLPFDQYCGHCAGPYHAGGYPVRHTGNRNCRGAELSFTKCAHQAFGDSRRAAADFNQRTDYRSGMDLAFRQFSVGCVLDLCGLGDGRADYPLPGAGSSAGLDTGKEGA